MTLSNPAAVMERLASIENDLAEMQNEYETAALNWFRVKRDKEKKRAEAFMGHEGAQTEKKVRADAAAAEIGVEEEALYEAYKVVERVLSSRASIGQSILRAQSQS